MPEYTVKSSGAPALIITADSRDAVPSKFELVNPKEAWMQNHAQEMADHGMSAAAIFSSLYNPYEEGDVPGQDDPRTDATPDPTPDPAPSKKSLDEVLAEARANNDARRQAMAKADDEIAFTGAGLISQADEEQ